MQGDLRLWRSDDAEAREFKLSIDGRYEGGAVDLGARVCGS